MFYLDSSAIVKLVAVEAESLALQQYLASATPWTSSSLSRVEVMRHATRRSVEVAETAARVLGRIGFIPVSPRVIDLALAIQPAALRTLDAIHVATALSIRDDLDALVTYDRRMLEAVALHGVRAASPGLATA